MHIVLIAAVLGAMYFWLRGHWFVPAVASFAVVAMTGQATSPPLFLIGGLAFFWAPYAIHGFIRAHRADVGADHRPGLAIEVRAFAPRWGFKRRF